MGSFNVSAEQPISLVSRLKKASHKTLSVSCIRKVLDLLRKDTPPPVPSPFTPLPGPWGFLTSGYIIGLVVMAILLHRIQNIVVPPRHHLPNRVLLQRNRLFSPILYTVFPLDLSSTVVRFVLRLPSLYFLGRSLLLWLVTWSQTADKYPPWNSQWLPPLGHWVAQQEMATLCWSTFCSICGALCMEALTRGLDGASSNGSPFNLFGYAFLLHIYSSPMTHKNRLEGLPSRPDKHVVFTIILPLLHVAMVHCLGIKQKWSDHRLIPSAIITLVGLIHFHGVLWFSDSSYPLLNYLPCLFESLLLFCIVLAIFLNALTQLVTEGSITRPLYGHHSVLLPKWEEDFSVALLRMGMASLETSAVAGLGNEVGSVSALTTSVADQTEQGTVELGRCGVASVSQTFEGQGKSRRLRMGFANEIKCVKATSTETDPWLDRTWYREVARFSCCLTRCIWALCQLFWEVVRGRSGLHGRLRNPNSSADKEDDEADVSSLPGQHGKQDEADVYDKFVRGEDVSDDEQDEFEPMENTSASCSRASSSSPWDSADEEDSQQETVSLYADLSSAVSVSTSPSHLLAHMTDTSTSPLTRRRFNQMLTGTGAATNSQNGGDDGWMEVVRARRPLAVSTSSSSNSAAWSSDELSESRRNCVICTVEPRQIICWPCRCLALCDDCRQNLASRSSASKHICPCCRRSVEGYSRLYIP